MAISATTFSRHLAIRPWKKVLGQFEPPSPSPKFIGCHAELDPWQMGNFVHHRRASSIARAIPFALPENSGNVMRSADK